MEKILQIFWRQLLKVAKLLSCGIFITVYQVSNNIQIQN